MVPFLAMPVTMLEPGTRAAQSVSVFAAAMAMLRKKR